MQLTKSRWLRIAIALGIVFFLGQTTFAQFNARLQGTIEDADGNVVSGATVTITNTSTQQTATQTTGDTGYYSFSELPPGTYNVDVNAANFKKASFTNIGIAAESPRNLDAKLAAGGAAETVTVTADEVPALQTADASVSGTLTNENIERLPTFGRDPYELLRLAPGITGDSARAGAGNSVFLPNGVGGKGQSNFGVFQTENEPQISAAGQRVSSNTYQIDGVTVDSLGFGGTAVVTPNPESVDQITVVSSSFNAEDGRNVGGHIKTVTRSGTNSWHGSAFFQYDEPGLNAFNRYGGPNGAKTQRVANKNREYAGSIGGPILHDKLFAFFSYEGFKSNSNPLSTVFIATPQLRALIATARPNGVSNLVLNSIGSTARIANVLTPSCATAQITNPAQCQVVSGGLDIFAPAGSIGQYQPGGASNISPTNPFDGIPDVEQVQVFAPTNLHGHQFNGRVDFNVNQNNQLAASFFRTYFTNFSADSSTGATPQSDLPFTPVNTAATVVYIHTFSPTLLNEARANFTRFDGNQLAQAGNVNFGIPRVEVQDFPFGRLQFGAPQGGTSPGIFVQNTYEGRDTLIKTFGSHTLRGGIVFRNEQDNDNLVGGIRPDFVFDGIQNLFNDTPVFEAITASPITGGPGNTARYYRDNYYAAFLQHDWKLLANLTINTGLRYEYFGPPHNKGARTNQPVFGAGAGNELIGASLQPVSDLYKASKYDFAPKFGFAWSPRIYNGNTVIRGGFGVSYDRLDENLFTPQRENGPGIFNYGICCGTPNNPFDGGLIQYNVGTSKSIYSFPANTGIAKLGVNPKTNTPNALPFNNVTVETYGTQANTPNPYLYSYALDVQTQLPYGIVSDIGYQGSSGHKFIRLVNQNFKFTNFVAPCAGTFDNTCVAGVNSSPFFAFFIPTPDVHTNYNGLDATFSRRFKNGFTGSATYTFSKSLDQVSNEGPGFESNQTNPNFPKTEYGPSDFNNRNRFTAFALYEVPKFNNGKGIGGVLLSGWQVNGIYTWHSGFPYTPVIGINGAQLAQNSSTPNPIRPFGYLGGAGTSCSNGSFKTPAQSNFPGGGKAFFITTPPPTGPNGTPNLQPGIGRNSFYGPCYQDTDLSVVKNFSFTGWGDHIFNLKLQGQAFNVFNQLNLQPLQFGTAQTDVNNPLFGTSNGGDAGRVLELLARFTF